MKFRSLSVELIGKDSKMLESLTKVIIFVPQKWDIAIYIYFFFLKHFSFTELHIKKQSPHNFLSTAYTRRIW